MDAVGCARICRTLSIIALILALAASCLGQATPGGGGAGGAAEAEYKNGIALASSNRLDEAAAAFVRGSRLAPNDPRFLVELGGISFKQKNHRQAIKWLDRAKGLGSSDPYVNDFLGTLYFIEGNQEAALKYWNRAGKPRMSEIRLEPGLRVDPVVLDRSFAFSKGEVLTLDDMWATETRLNGLGIFSMFSLRTAARPDGTFDVTLNAQEWNGFGSKWEAMLSTFGGIFYGTATPEYYNVGGSATKLTSLWRWDEEKRRIEAAVSGPLRRSPKWRYSVGMDLRNENWSVRNFSNVGLPSLGFLNVRRSAGGADITSLKSGRWTWSAGGEISYRDYRSISEGALLTPGLLIEGYQLKQRVAATWDVLRIPEKRYRLTVTGSSQLGRVWGNGGDAFEKVQGGLTQTWSLMDKRDDLEMQVAVRGGKTWGNPPFDEMFMLGLERDNDLKMRAHVGTRDGQKGNAPLGRNYFVTNWELDKRVWGNGLVTVQLGPWIDAGKITDPLNYLGTKQWLWDAGGQMKVKVLGLKVGLSYGRDLRAGRSAFYTWVGK